MSPYNSVMRHARSEIKPELLKRACWSQGMTVTELSRRIGRSRNSVYRAIREPRRFPLTYQRIVQALPDFTI